jgi:uncharacterized protein
MIIKVKVKAGSSKQSIENFGDNNYLIYLKEPPEKNRANIELINFLSKQFCTPVGKIKIKSGISSSQKIIELM